MCNIPGEYAGLIRRAEQALDYTYRIRSNYLKHGLDKRKMDLESAKEFLESVRDDVRAIPLSAFIESEYVWNIRRVIEREYGGMEEELGICSL